MKLLIAINCVFEYDQLSLIWHVKRDMTLSCFLDYNRNKQYDWRELNYARIC